jgi:hypothetical protein
MDRQVLKTHEAQIEHLYTRVQELEKTKGTKIQAMENSEVQSQKQGRSDTSTQSQLVMEGEQGQAHAGTHTQSQVMSESEQGQGSQLYIQWY